MYYLNNNELYEVSGGGITATFLNAVSRMISTVYDIGRAFGSSLRRITSGNVCKI